MEKKKKHEKNLQKIRGSLACVLWMAAALVLELVWTISP